ncbi:MAG: long-chain fatty acid--CoA ligase [Haloarculaceae archaeon]
MASDAVQTEEGTQLTKRGPPATIPEESLAEWFVDRAETYADMPAAYVDDGDGYEPVTFEAFAAEARAVAGGLQDLGLTAGDRLAIQSGTRYEWSVVDVASLLAGVVLVPVYPTFSGPQSAYVIEDAGAAVLVTESADVHREVSNVTETVLDVADLPHGEFDGAPGQGRAPDDLTTLIYTSGTTGDPKGVQLTHRNLRGEMAVLAQTLPEYEPGKRATCFLPLSHIYQRMTNYYAWNDGHSAVFMSPDTLVEDLRATEPHFLATVPRVYRRMHDGVQDQVAEMGAPKANLVRWALGVAEAYGRAIEDGGPGRSPGLRAKHALADRLVFSTLREQLGLTNVEFAITGAASLDARLLHLFWGLDVPLLEVYGATETTGGVTFNRMDAFRAGTVGKPLPETEVRLADDGEVLVRGPTVTPGYWNLPEATEASLTDGWYHTGDVGEWDGDFLKIVDRKKHMQVLDTGKNVYSDPIETVLRRQPHVGEVLVEAEGRKFVSALVQPNFGALLTAAAERGVDYDESAVVREDGEVVAVPEALLDHPEIQALFESEIEAANEELADYETVKRFAVISRAFSVERDELTPTLKKRRRDIRDHFADRLDAMYEEAG